MNRSILVSNHVVCLFLFAGDRFSNIPCGILTRWCSWGWPWSSFWSSCLHLLSIGIAGVFLCAHLRLRWGCSIELRACQAGPLPAELHSKPHAMYFSSLLRKYLQIGHMSCWKHQPPVSSPQGALDTQGCWCALGWGLSVYDNSCLLSFMLTHITAKKDTQTSCHPAASLFQNM